MNIAEILLFLALIVGVYFILKPIQVRLERWLLNLMGRPSGRNGQGSVYRMKRPGAPGSSPGSSKEDN